MASSDVYSTVFSLRRNDGRDYLLTVSPSEKQALLQSGLWAELCHPFVGPTAFCVDPSLQDGSRGPFLLRSQVNDVRGGSDAHQRFAGFRPVYRCVGEEQLHFFSSDPQCDQRGRAESVLGYASVARGGDTLRELFHCFDSAALLDFHSLDIPCPSHTAQTSVGFVT